jgi:hypothetical protein
VTDLVERTRGAIEGEDVLLGLWNLVALPLGALIPGSWSGTEPSPLAGLLMVGAVAGAIVALATRPSGPRPRPTEARLWLFAGPLVGALALVGQTGAERLAFPGTGLVLGVAFVGGMVAFVFSDRLPVIDRGIRRALVLPLVLVGAAIFQEFSAQLLDGIDLVGLLTGTADAAATSPEMAALGLFVLTMIVGGAATFFLMLVVAPRELAEPEPHLGVWIVRFALFLISSATGVSLWFLV